MATSEEDLHEHLRNHPEDWSTRLELGDRLIQRGETSEAASLIEAADSAPGSEEELRRAIDQLGEIRSDARGFLSPFAAEHPSTPLGHWALSIALLDAGESDRARSHYQTAVALDPAYRSEEMDHAMNPEATAAQTEAEPGSPEAPMAVIVEPEDETLRTAEPVEEAAGGPSDEYATDEGDRAFVVGEREAIKAAEKEPETASKLTAVGTAILVHLGLTIVLGTVAVTVPRIDPPQIVATSEKPNEEQQVEQQTMERVQRTPTQSAAAQMEVVSAAAASSVAAPNFDSTEFTSNPIGAGQNFGMSMSLGGGEGEGMVSFFGSKSKAKKVVFVVDASASMGSTGGGSKTKFELMKEELTKTIRALPPTVEFQLIFFSGPAWFASEGYDKEGWRQWEKNGRKLNFWHYGDGDPANLPKEDYEQATRGGIQRAINDIEDTTMSYGTDWRAPLKMAMNLEPDLIYFMTDGAVGKHPEKPPVVEDLLDYNRVKGLAKINTICLMELKAFDMLEELADKTRGEFTLVLEDGTSLRGEELEELAKNR